MADADIRDLMPGSASTSASASPPASTTCEATAGMSVPHADSKVVANYYQTLDSAVTGQMFTHWYAAALHFGTEEGGAPYIHWNDWHPDDDRLRDAWLALEQLNSSGVTVTFMLGGAGGAFGALFADFEAYYALLRDLLCTHPVIHGLDLDIEEPVDLDDVRMLIRRLDADFGCEFVITMAPLASSLAADVAGMGGFVYKDLWSTPEGARINWFNGQFYGGAWSCSTLDAIVSNGYPASKVVMGMLYADFPQPHDMQQAMAVLAECNRAHPGLRGAYLWEHALAADGPAAWAAAAAEALSPPVEHAAQQSCGSGNGREHLVLDADQALPSKGVLRAGRDLLGTLGCAVM